MSLTVTPIHNGPVYEVVVTNKLHKVDYNVFLPLLRTGIIHHGKIRLLIQLHNFHGWDAGAFWEDLKFGIKDFNHFDRIAMVGENKWEKAMTLLAKPFIPATVKYFDYTDREIARSWLLEEEKEEEEEAPAE